MQNQPKNLIRLKRVLLENFLLVIQKVLLEQLHVLVLDQLH